MDLMGIREQRQQLTVGNCVQVETCSHNHNYHSNNKNNSGYF